MTRIDSILMQLAPKIHAEYLLGFADENLFEEYEINTPLRKCHFLAQVLHETGGLRVLRENMNYSASRIMQIFGVGKHSAKVTTEEAKALAGDAVGLAERVYGIGNPRKAAELGNTKAGDGWTYRGGGALQTTGKSGYERLRARTGHDYVQSPNLITQGTFAVLPAFIFWQDNRLNTLADENNIRDITKVVNGGYNGYEDRVAWFNKLWAVLGDGTKPWEHATPEVDTLWLQQALNNLGADPQLTVDGRFGPATELAVKAFQHRNHLDVDGIAGPITLAAIKLRLTDSGTPENKAVVPVDNSLIATGGLGTMLSDYAKELLPYKDVSQYILYAFIALLLAGVLLKAWATYKERRNLTKPKLL